MKKTSILIIFVVLVSGAIAQTKDAYETSGEKSKGGLFDPARLTVNHSLSFGMGSNSGISSLKSQSMYGTMLQYSFVAPVTLNLNFALPIHSTFNSSQNLNMNNLRSADYFNSIPFDFSMTWKPSENTNFTLSISKMNYYDYYGNYGFYGYNMWNRSPFPYAERDK
ncbi:MAG TPA: hypothetical protein VHO70_12725 [Chitinispirillaceae bacterium]|nr:hypothetical protein [Chitinispirillaceae bacterium]